MPSVTSQARADSRDSVATPFQADSVTQATGFMVLHPVDLVAVFVLGHSGFYLGYLGGHPVFEVEFTQVLAVEGL